ncbi:MAG TPA: macro domain-containing protein [Capsulimonadaceae bacterium]|nr:macro domain-containing protein [Capsulimonadaceae bacterium]
METFQIHHTTLDILQIDQPGSQGALGGSAPAGQGPGKSTHQLELGYRVALAQANANHLDSIAFQGVDTQICGCPLDQAAAAAVGAVQEFLEATPNTSLRRILFVQYSPEAYRAFCDALRNLASGSSQRNNPGQQALSQRSSA